MNLNKGHALIAVLSICLSFSVGTNIKTSEEHKKIRSKIQYLLPGKIKDKNFFNYKSPGAHAHRAPGREGITGRE